MQPTHPSTAKPPQRPIVQRVLWAVLWLVVLYFLAIVLAAAVFLSGAFGVLDCASWAHCSMNERTLPFFTEFGNHFNFVGPGIWLLALVLGWLPKTGKRVSSQR